MDYIADLHIHSPYSRATSPQSTLAGLAGWARVKGIQVIGTGDFTHPGWFGCLKEALEPAEPGLFKLKNEAAIVSPLAEVRPSAAPVRFLLSAEISSIYKRHGVVRKVHNLLYVPDFASAERLNAREILTLHASHASLASMPAEVAALIDRAATALAKG